MLVFRQVFQFGLDLKIMESLWVLRLEHLLVVTVLELFLFHLHMLHFFDKHLFDIEAATLTVPSDVLLQSCVDEVILGMEMKIFVIL